MSQIRVTLRKSLIGQKWRLRRTVAGMGLTKINQSRLFPDNGCTKGMIQKVRHLVEAELVTDTGESSAAPAAETAATETSE